MTKMIGKYWRDLMFSVVINFIVLFALYNTKDLEYYNRNIIILCFYFFWTLCMYHFTKITNIFLVFISIITCLLVDISTIFTGPQLMPFRFPIPTIFTIIGSLAAYLVVKKYMRTSILLICTFLCLHIIIGKRLEALMVHNKILNVQTTKNILKISLDKFIDIKGDTLVLNDILSKKHKTIIDTYFIGCSACVYKEDALRSLLKQSDTSTYNIIFICANMDNSTFNDFKAQQDKVEGNNVTYLYDYQRLLETKMNIDGYPYEFVLNNNIVIHTMKGFDKGENLKSIYINEKYKFLKSE